MFLTVLLGGCGAQPARGVEVVEGVHERFPVGDAGEVGLGQVAGGELAGLNQASGLAVRVWSLSMGWGLGSARRLGYSLA